MPGKILDLVAAQHLPEELTGHALHLVSLVEHNGVVRRNDRPEVVLVRPHGEVGEEQVVVDHHQIRLAGALVHLGHEAL